MAQLGLIWACAVRGVAQDLMAHKLVFIETVDVVETTLALDNFRRACDCGRGAVFLSVARGKVLPPFSDAPHLPCPSPVLGRCAGGRCGSLSGCLQLLLIPSSA